MRPKVVPPDGGWGWMIVACAFINQFLCVGTALSLGILYVYWLDEFNEGKGLTSWIISTLFFVMCAIGPLPASLAEKYGFRVVTVIGGFLTSLGFFISSFATSVIFLIGTVGILAGTGVGFVYLSSFATVSLYFGKRRTLANGVSTSGAGIGSIILPLLMKELEDMYGWRGALWILSAMMLHICATGLLLRPLESYDKGSYSKGESTSLKTTQCLDSTNNRLFLTKDSRKDSEDEMTHLDIANVNSCAMANDENNKDHCLKTVDNLICFDSQTFPHNKNSKSMTTHLKCKNQIIKSSSKNHQPFETSPPGIFHTDTTNKNRLGSAPHNIPNANEFDLERCRGQVNKITITLGNVDTVAVKIMPNIVQNTSATASECDDDDCPSKSPVPLPPHSHEIKTDLSYSYCQKDQDERFLDTNSSHRPTMMDALRQYIDLLRDVRFMIFALSIFILNCALLICVVYIGDRVVDEGLGTSMGALVLSFNGIGNVIGRIFFGLVADRLFKDHVICFMLIIGTMGVSTLLSFFCGKHAAMHCVYAAIFGITLGGHIVLWIGVTVALMGLDKTTLALGMTLAFAGTGDLIGPPIGGLLYDMTQSYQVSFIVAGILLLISTVIIIPIRSK